MDSFYKGIVKALLGEKKLEVIEILIKNIDNNGHINLTINEICNFSNASKPTVIATFKVLENSGIFTRIKNGVYKLQI